MTTTLATPSELTQIVECPRCTGKGNIESFSHIANGRCFLCAGNRTIEIRQLLGGKKTLSMVVFKATPARAGRVPAHYDNAGKIERTPGRASTVVSISCEGRNGTEWTRDWDLAETSPASAEALRSLFRAFIAEGRRVQVNFADRFYWESSPYAKVWNGSSWDRQYGAYEIMD